MSLTSSGGGDGRNWEGLGGPIRILDDNHHQHSGVDPTLDSCCQREQADAQRSSALRRTLQRYDVVAERERRRRHLVVLSISQSQTHTQQSPAAEGCRCCYDPERDGGDYPALAQWRRAAMQQEADGPNDDAHDDDTNQKDPKRHPESPLQYPVTNNNGSADDNDDDDEFDYLLDEDLPNDGNNTNDALIAFEETRRAELEWDFLQREIAVYHGYGVHRQMHPSRVLKAAGLASFKNAATTSKFHSTSESPAASIVLHLYDPDSFASASLDEHLEQTLAPAYPGTKFMRSAGRAALLLNRDLLMTMTNGNNNNMMLSKLEPDADMPVLIAIRDGSVVNLCPRLEGLTTTEDDDDNTRFGGGNEVSVIVEPRAVTEWLDRSGVLLDRSQQHVDAMCRIRPEEEALMDTLMSSVTNQQQRLPTIMSDFLQQRYDCGKADCAKSFPHQHIGEQNEQHDGLVVSEEQILSNVHS